MKIQFVNGSRMRQTWRHEPGGVSQGATVQRKWMNKFFVDQCGSARNMAALHSPHFKALKPIPFRRSRSFWEGFSYFGQSVLRPSRHTGEDWRALVKRDWKKLCFCTIPHAMDLQQPRMLHLAVFERLEDSALESLEPQ